MARDIASSIDVEELIEQADKKIARMKSKEAEIITESVIAAMGRGDHSAFSTVYLHSVGPLTDFLEILLQSRQDAEEVAQETFSYIWENHSRIDPAKNFKGYLYTIAKTAAFKQMARRKQDALFADYTIHAPEEFGLSPDEIVMTKELSLLINLYFDNMPAQRKRVFEMSRIEGKSNKEIAQELNLSLPTVKMHLRLAMKGFRDLVMLSLYFFSAQ